MSMKKSRLIISLAILAVLVGVWIFGRNGSSKTSLIAPDPGFAQYITAYSGGSQGAFEPVRCVFTMDIPDKVRNQLPAEELFSISPHAEGKLSWTDAHTLSFQPEKPLKRNQVYQVEVALNKLIGVTDTKFNTFQYQFKVMPQEAELVALGLKPDESQPQLWVWEGQLLLADRANQAILEQAFTVNAGDNQVKIDWEHDPSGLEHQYRITGLKKGTTQQSIAITFKTEEIGGEGEISLETKLEKEGDFVLREIRTVQFPEPYLVASFSEVLDPTQMIESVCRVAQEAQSKMWIQGNEIIIYPPSGKQSGKVIIDANLKSATGQSLNLPSNFDFDFQDRQPAFSLLGDGVILPSTEGLLLPFKAINLKSVEASIFRISDQHMGQFLQANQLTGNQELNRVGKPLLIRRLNLQNSGHANLNRWQTYSIDLSPWFKAEPGALYRVVLNFTKNDVRCKCPESTDDGPSWMSKLIQLVNPNEIASFNEGGYYDEYNQNYSGYYDWAKRDDPCNSAFYDGNKNHQARNLLVSDIGLMAKKESEGQWLLLATQLKNATPMSGVKLSLRSYQDEVIAEGVTDADGRCWIKTKRQPYYLRAEHRQQRAFLRVDPSSVQNVAAFDIAGVGIQNGQKGFLYTERGVWRPGDSVFVGFMLDDSRNQLPQGFPVVFELLNPQEQVMKREVLAWEKKPLLTFRTSTEEDAPTGSWSIRAKVGPNEFVKRIRVEAIKPNRLRIDWPEAPEMITSEAQKSLLKLQSFWLHGAPAAGLKAVVEGNFIPQSVNFKGYSGYEFNPYGKSGKSASSILFASNLNQLGSANIQLPPVNRNQSPGMLRLDLKTRVFEPGGDASIDVFSIDYSPYDAYVGLKIPAQENNYWLDASKAQKLNLVVLNPQGKPIKGNKTLQLSLKKVEWRWWWQEEEEELPSYENGQAVGNERIWKIEAVNGLVSTRFEFPEKKWGRYLLEVTDTEGGHTTSTMLYADDGSGGPSGEDNQWASMLSFNIEKPTYNTGEEVKISIPAHQGRVFVSLENGSKIVSSFWKEVSPENRTITFKATPEMSPMVYAHITLLQPHQQRQSGLPIRLFGIKPISIMDPASVLTPRLKVPETLKPATDYSVSVSESNGKPMSYTLAVVDEGLLGLTRFKTPDPWSAFHTKEALGVQTWDLFDLVSGGYAGQTGVILGTGGDGSELSPESQKTNRFAPVVQFLGPFQLSSGESAQHKLKMPNYIGAVRLMVVATSGIAQGAVEKSVPVRQDLMLMATLPRFIRPGDQAGLGVTIFADKKVKSPIKIQAVINGAATVIGAKEQLIQPNGRSEYQVFFPVKALSKTGNVNIKFAAISGSYQASFSDDLKVMQEGNPVRKLISSTVQPSQSWTAAPPWKDATFLKASMSIAGSPTFPLVDLVREMEQYPHSCAEQISSVAMARLALLNSGFIADSKQKEALVQSIKTFLIKLARYQTQDGQFALWPKSENADAWVTTLVGHTMVLAKQAGFSPVDQVYSAWQDKTKQLAENFPSGKVPSLSLNTQAYRLMVMALAGNALLPAMNRLRENQELPLLGRNLLGMAYAISGRIPEARRLSKFTSTKLPVYAEQGGSWGSDLRDEAFLLMSLQYAGLQSGRDQLFRQLAAELSSDRWSSTHALAISLWVLTKEMQIKGKPSALQYQWGVSGKVNKINTAATLSNQEIGAIKPSDQISMKNDGKTPLYVQTVFKGVRFTPQPAASAGIKLSVVFKNQSGKVIQASEMRKGMDVSAEWNISAPGCGVDLRGLALKIPLAAGMEMLEDPVGNFDWSDRRDDRVFLYLDILKGRTVTLKTKFQLTYSGQYFWPGASIESLYDNAWWARLSDKTLQIAP